MLQNKVVKNASWIIACKIAQSVLSFLISIFTARYLGPSQFGLIGYAESIVAFAVPIMQLGLNNILVQEILDNKKKEGEVLGTALLMSMLSSLLCIAGVISFVFVLNPDKPSAVIVCALYSIILVFQALELTQYWFQAKYLSKYTSITALVAYLVVSAYKFFLLVSGKDVYWFAISNAIDYLLISVTELVIYKKLGGQPLSFSKTAAVRMFKKSRYYIVSSLMVTIFAQTDRIMLTEMIDDAATGYYNVAVKCVTITGFVFSAIIDSARPSIFESVKYGKENFEKSMVRLYSIIIYLSLLQCVGMTVLAEPIIDILYGAEYAPSINALRVVVWYSTFSYLGAVRNIWILVEEKQKYLWMINLSGTIVNIVLNLVLIPHIGIIGAALASLITQVFTNVIIGFIIKPIRYNNRLMLRGLNPKVLTEAISEFLKK